MEQRYFARRERESSGADASLGSYDECGGLALDSFERQIERDATD